MSNGLTMSVILNIVLNRFTHPLCLCGDMTLVTIVTISITKLLLLTFRSVWALTNRVTSRDSLVSVDVVMKTVMVDRSTSPWLQRLESPF